MARKAKKLYNFTIMTLENQCYVSDVAPIDFDIFLEELYNRDIDVIKIKNNFFFKKNIVRIIAELKPEVIKHSFNAC